MQLGALAALAIAWPGSTRAYRPFDSTDATVATRGDMEIELGPIGFVKQGSRRQLVAPSLIFNWGFASGWELVLEGRQFVQLDHVAGEPRFRVEDTALSLKRVLREGSLHDRTGPSIATEFGLVLPTINADPGVGAQDTIIFSQRWTDLTVHLDAAVAWTRAHRLGLFGGVIVEAHDAWPIRPVAELFVEGEHDVPTVISALAGAVWRTADDLSFDAAVRFGHAAGLDTTEIRLGLTWTFALGVPR